MGDFSSSVSRAVLNDDSADPWHSHAEDIAVRFAQAMQHRTSPSLGLADDSRHDTDAWRGPDHALLKAVVDNLSTGVVLSIAEDGQTPVVYINPAFSALTGYVIDEVAGVDDRILFGPATSEQSLLRIRNAKAAERPFRANVLCYRKDGSKFWGALSIFPLRNDAAERIGYATLVSEVASDLETITPSPEVRLSSLNYHDEAVRFSVDLVHELRTPLTAIVGFAEIFEREMFGAFPHQKYREYSRDIVDSGNYLLSLVSDILDYAKAAEGKLELDETVVDVESVIDVSIKMIQQRAEAAGVHLSTAIAADATHLRADERRMRQILINLLVNAVKFTPTGGEILVSASREPGRGILISVLDTGTGIRKEDFPMVVAPFGQVKLSPAGAREGTGLGLPLTKRLIEAHDGALEILSSVNQGTIFVIEFPLNRAVP